MTKPDVSDGLLVTGVGLSSFGAWLVYPPAGAIVCGVLVLSLGVAIAWLDRNPRTRG